jgi:hypothetical protein
MDLFFSISFGRTSLDYDFMNLNTKHHINWTANACYHDQKQILIPRFTHTHSTTLQSKHILSPDDCQWRICVCVYHME